jgi:hypothetical protein
MKSKILLFSDGIQSGKTATLLNWIKGKNNVCGILTPDVDEIRMLYDITQNKYYPFETDVNEIVQVEVIGRFVFLKSAFDKAIEILKNAITLKPEWLITLYDINLQGKRIIFYQNLSKKLSFSTCLS